MLNKRLQNKIAEGRNTLPVVALYAFVASLASGLMEHEQWLSFALLACSAYLMMELNNSNILIRIYSRMVSCSFLALMVMCPFLLLSPKGSLVQVCFITFYLLFFHAYQDRTASAWVFYAFAALGIASLFFVQLLYLVPLLWILMAVNILAFSGRTFSASVLGLLTPYWFVWAYDFYKGDITQLSAHFSQLAEFGPLFDFAQLDSHQMIAFFFVSVLAIMGSVHFLRNSYQDKIRTRMLYDIFIVVELFAMLFLILQPCHYDFLIRVMIINAAPLIGHFLALTNTKVTNIAFIVILFFTLVITAHNLWIPSFTF